MLRWQWNRAYMASHILVYAEFLLVRTLMYKGVEVKNISFTRNCRKLAILHWAIFQYSPEFDNILAICCISFRAVWTLHKTYKRSAWVLLSQSTAALHFHGTDWHRPVSVESFYFRVMDFILRWTFLIFFSISVTNVSQWLFVNYYFGHF